MAGVFSLLGMIGSVVGLGLMMWAVIDLTRLRSHPKFRSFFAGNLRLHFLVFGLGKTSDLDQTTRDKINGLRKRILLGVLIVVFSLAVQMAGFWTQMPSE
jgi:hypothetical protein